MIHACLEKRNTSFIVNSANTLHLYIVCRISCIVLDNRVVKDNYVFNVAENHLVLELFVVVTYFFLTKW